MHARDDEHRNLVNVVGEVHDRFADAQHLPFARTAASLEVGARNLAPSLADRCAFFRVSDDHEMPVLRIAGRGRLLRELETLLEHPALHRAGEVEPLPHGARRGKKLVRSQLESGDAEILVAGQRREIQGRAGASLDQDVRLRIVCECGQGGC